MPGGTEVFLEVYTTHSPLRKLRVIIFFTFLKSVPDVQFLDGIELMASGGMTGSERHQAESVRERVDADVTDI